ncbi:MAG: Ig-like domain-containing protein, partial [Pirellulales bacterium]
FTYATTEGLGGADAAMVTIDVVAVNDDPVAVDDTFEVDADSVGNVLDVLANDHPGPDAGETLLITGVGPRSDGGVVVIAGDQASLLYQPVGGFVGMETFTYTIEDGNGGSDQALVTVDVQGAESVVLIQLATTDLAGTPVTSVAPGADFVLVGSVQDVRLDPEGVFAAYLDVTFDASLASINGPIEHGADYPNAPSGDLSVAGLIDEVGGADGLGFPAGTGGDVRELFSITMTATQSGDVTFDPDAADDLSHAVLVFGENVAVPLSQVEFVPTTLSISGPAFMNAANPLDVNADGLLSPLDALSVINDLNRYGARDLAAPSVASTAAVSQQLVSTPIYYIDVNGDGSVTPIDALVVINALNAQAAGTAATAAVAAIGEATGDVTGTSVGDDLATHTTLSSDLTMLPDAGRTLSAQPYSRTTASTAAVASADGPVLAPSYAGVVSPSLQDPTSQPQPSVLSVPVDEDATGGALDSVLDQIANDVAEAWHEMGSEVDWS